MRRDGLKPVQPHNPKIYQLHLWDNISVFGVLKISKLKMQFACLRFSIYMGKKNPTGFVVSFMKNIYFTKTPAPLQAPKTITCCYFPHEAFFIFLQVDCRVFALSLWLQGWMDDCSLALVTTLLGPINSASLLEHQVMANQALKRQPGLTVLIFPQLELRTSRVHSWVP